MHKFASLFLVVPSLLLLLVLHFGATPTRAASVSSSTSADVCRRELANANATISKWADQMESMVNESKLPAQVRESIHNEANKILDLIEDFGQQFSSQPASQLARDLVAIRRRSNKMALDIYLNTFDMRWPQNSLQLGVLVERVQQACLDQLAIRQLEAPPAAVDQLLRY